ncbi:hypothetical protein [Pseudarthrobacter sp. fls2-241-R2A-127]|uniref:hypothetical protein n=1 Tax=Pseudarthrobacter sp. fls2-241-R2A-127 TaxID=3040303 RepID=UPI0025543393|nr:hypothetical protein [Pseudarthrobacter sp. fls2-241-R2A-127]
MATGKNADNSAETANKRKAQLLGWVGVLVLFLAAFVAQFHSSLSLTVIGVGMVMLGAAMLITKQWGARLLIGVGAAVGVAGVVLAVIFQG